MYLRKRIISLIAAVAVAFSGSVYALENDSKAAANENTSYSTEYEIYKQLVQSIVDSYIDDTLTSDEVIEKGISELLNGNENMLIALLKSTFKSLDAYSEFFTAEEYQSYINQINRTFYGIGVELKDVNGYTEITGFVEENGLAEQSGFRIGDKIIAVNGVDVVGRGSAYIRNLIVGDVNTTVSISVKRGDDVIELIGIRKEVKQETVSSGILEGNIGYVKILSFGKDTANEFSDVVRNFEDHSTRNVILDLRNNTGGILDAAVEIAKMIVPKGKIIDVKYRDKNRDETYTSDLIKPELKFFVLVNENTASSAEILASAIQDSGVGKLVGTKTYGKAVIQTATPLMNGSVYKMTTGQYITRNGREINGKGLTPDYKVENYMEKIDKSQYSNPDFSNRYSLGNNSEAVKAAKERLYMLGIYSGSVENGFFDESFRSALCAFQEENHLSPDGVLDIATQIMLDRKFERLEKEVDVQLQTAYKMYGGNVDNLY